MGARGRFLCRQQGDGAEMDLTCLITELKHSYKGDFSQSRINQQLLKSKLIIKIGVRTKQTIRAIKLFY